jgi:1,6-anhydro-N-acetylmuramate kinase
MNKNSQVAPMSAASAPSTARRRIDVKAIMGTHLRPYAIVKNWRNEFEIHKEYSPRFAKNVNGVVMALSDDQDWNSRVETLVLACDLRDALPSRDAIEQAMMMILSALQAPFDEANCRLLIGIMCDVMKGRAEDESAAVSIDMMVWRLEELRLDDEDDLAAPVAAIAGAVAQLIDEQSFRPSIHEVRDRVVMHWHKLRADLGAVRGLRNFAATLDELVPAETEASPVAWCDGQTDDDSIPF